MSDPAVYLLLLQFVLVELTGPRGHVIELNPHAVVTVRRVDTGNKHFVTGIHCVVTTVDGKFISVRESCNKVRQLVEDAVRGIEN
jgi:hypothetical protein